MSYNPVILPQIKVAFQQLLPLLDKLHNPSTAKAQFKELVANIRAKKQVIDGLKRQLNISHLKKGQYEEKEWQKLDDGVKQLEEKVNTIGADSQAAQVKQEQTKQDRKKAESAQKQQDQAIQAMYAIVKNLNETAQAIVKRIA